MSFYRNQQETMKVQEQKRFEEKTCKDKKERLKFSFEFDISS
jgi:hypothetical protein